MTRWRVGATSDPVLAFCAMTAKSPAGFSELVAAFAAAQPAPVGRGVVRAICVRKGGGVHETPDAVELTVSDGVEGDRWSAAHDPERAAQVTLMSATVAGLIAHDGAAGHEAGDNFYVDLDLGEAHLPAGSRVRLGSAWLEITDKPHLGCKKFAARFGEEAMRWINHPDQRALHLRGVNARVITSGRVCVGDEVEVAD